MAFPQQTLLELAAGPVHRDDSGELTALRDRLACYPRDVWLHQMAARWQRLAQLEAFVGRTGEVGDDLGSRVVAASIARDAMHLGLLQERRYAPYAKWLGTAFAATPAAAEVGPHLAAALAAATWQDREAAVVRALTALGARHDALEVTDPVAAEPQQFFERPFRVLFVEAYADALRGAVRDPIVAALPHDLGGIDPITDSTMALADRSLRGALTHWWRTGGEEEGDGAGRHTISS